MNATLSPPAAEASPRAVAQPPEDAALVGALSRGDARAAIARCAQLHGTAMTRFARALLGDAAEAEEAAQEALLAAFDALAQFRGDAPIRGWLFGITRRICARRLEVRTRQARRRALFAHPDAAGAPVDDALDAARRSASVQRALEALRPTEREALLLRYQADLSYREVGEACGIDEAAARQRVSRALAKVRAKVEAGR